MRGSPRGHRRGRLRTDVLAGVIIWAVLVPESFACAQIAGVPPESGLYAMIPALLCYALLGGANHAPVGPISITAALSAVLVSPHAAGGGRFLALSAALALVAGCAGLVAGLARLGFAAALIAPPVLRGFTVGLVLTVVVGQLPKLLGLPDIAGSTWTRGGWIAGHLREAVGPGTLLGGLALLALLAGRRFVPTLPVAFAVLVGAVAVSRLWWLDTHGVEVVDPIDRGLPRPGWPTGIGTLDLLGLVGPALAVLVVGHAEGIHATEPAEPRPHREVDPNLELVGIGLANLGSGALSGMVVGGVAPTTAVSTGVRGRLCVLVAAVLTVITVALPGGLFERLPRPVLAAVAIAVVIRLADRAGPGRLYRVWRQRRGSVYERAAAADCLAAVATLLAVLVTGVLPGLLAGLALSTVLLACRARHCGTLRLRLWPLTAGLLLARLETGVCFANAGALTEAVLRARDPHTRTIVLDATSSPVFDTTAAATLGDLGDELAWHGVALRVVGGTEPVPDASGQAWSSGGRIGVYPTLVQALSGVTDDSP